MIFIEGDKAWCLFPRGAQRLIFLFFQMNTVLPTYCLSFTLFHHHAPSLSLRLGYSVPAGQVRRESASAAASSVAALHTDCVYWANTECFSVCVLLYFYLCED